MPGLDLRKIEHVVDDPQQGISRTLDRIQVLALLVIQLSIKDQLRHPDDSIHRGSDFVTHVGQKITLGTIGRLGLLLGMKQFQLRTFGLSDVPVGTDHPGPAAIGPSAGGPSTHQHPAPPPCLGGDTKLCFKEIQLTPEVRYQLMACDQQIVWVEKR